MIDSHSRPTLYHKMTKHLLLAEYEKKGDINRLLKTLF